MSFVSLWNGPPGHVNRFRGIAVSPKGIGQSRKPIDGESLGGEQDHGSLDDDKLFGPGDDAERNDERSRSCRRMAHAEQSHERARSR